MQVSGHVYRVDQLATFAPGYVVNPASPPAGTFSALANVRVSLMIQLVPIPLLGPLAQSTQTAQTAADGSFSITVPDNLVTTFLQAKAWMLVEQQVGSVTIPLPFGHPTTVPIFAPIYRSPQFPLGHAGHAPANAYVAFLSVPDNAGLTQAQVSSLVQGAAGGMGGGISLSASIVDGHIACRGQGNGVSATFDVQLAPSTSPNLGEFVTATLQNFHADIPFPQNLCVSSDKIQSALQSGLASASGTINANIHQLILNEANMLASPAAGALLDTIASVTFERLRFPVVQSIPLPIFGPIQIRNIVPDLCIGFPRSIVT